MTDSEKIDLILAEMLNMKSEMQGMKSEVLNMKSEVQDLNSEVQDIKKDIGALKRQIMKSTAELKAVDEMILDEVERVHGILEKHTLDTTVHTA